MAERARLPLGREPVDGASCLIGSCHAIPSRLLTIAWNAEPRLRPPSFSGAAAASSSIIVASMAVLLTESSRDWRSESESELQALSIAFRAGTGGVRGARCGTATEIIRERTAHSSLSLSRENGGLASSLSQVASRYSSLVGDAHCAPHTRHTQAAHHRSQRVQRRACVLLLARDSRQRA